ncbi:unnamed protein product, partial [Urochloa humidicola]
ARERGRRQAVPALRKEDEGAVLRAAGGRRGPWRGRWLAAGPCADHGPSCSEGGRGRGAAHRGGRCDIASVGTRSPPSLGFLRPLTVSRRNSGQRRRAALLSRRLPRQSHPRGAQPERDNGHWPRDKCPAPLPSSLIYKPQPLPFLSHALRFQTLAARICELQFQTLAALLPDKPARICELRRFFLPSSLLCWF